jgi:undecaprenyl diphosphate synthase
VPKDYLVNGPDLMQHSVRANHDHAHISSPPSSARRLPRHIGFIPDGNRRWAVQQGLPKDQGYAQGIAPGLALFEACKALGVHEVSVYGFTQDNTRRPSEQARSFRAACVAFALEIQRRGAALLVIGDEQSSQFPADLAPFRVRQGAGIKVNFLVNYGWEWDLAGLKDGGLRSADISRIDMVVRWGGGRRLSGFLPVQSVYADIFVLDDLWPDFQPQHLDAALAWFGQQDRTLGG